MARSAERRELLPGTPTEVEPPTGSPEPLPDHAIVISSAAMVTYSMRSDHYTLLDAVAVEKVSSHFGVIVTIQNALTVSFPIDEKSQQKSIFLGIFLIS